MKKLYFIPVLVVMLLSLTACGSSNGNGEDYTPSVPSEQVCTMERVRISDAILAEYEYVTNPYYMVWEFPVTGTVLDCYEEALGYRLTYKNDYVVMYRDDVTGQTNSRPPSPVSVQVSPGEPAVYEYQEICD